MWLKMVTFYRSGVGIAERLSCQLEPENVNGNAVKAVKKDRNEETIS